VFAGDYIWNLFLDYKCFNHSNGIYSFQIYDLDSVDDGVLDTLHNRIRGRTDWDLFVSHLIGLDHAGHTTNRSSPAISRKLLEY
jgi:GPI ethanolamine phosphate transferase 3 subunit O